MDPSSLVCYSIRSLLLPVLTLRIDYSLVLAGNDGVVKPLKEEAAEEQDAQNDDDGDDDDFY